MPIPKLLVYPTNVSDVPIPKNIDSELTYISNNTFCNVLQQISCLAGLANSIFEELTKDLSGITERSMRLSKRMKTISEDLAMLKKGEEELNTSNVSCDITPFVSKKPSDSQVLNKNTIPLSMRIQYEKAEAPPPVQIMDQLRDDGRVSMKMYSNPSFFFDLWSQEMLQGPKMKKNKKKKIKNKPVTQKKSQKPIQNGSNSVLIEQTGLGTGQIQMNSHNGIKYHQDLNRQDQGYQSSTSISDHNNVDHNLAMMTNQMMHLKNNQQVQNQQMINGNHIQSNNHNAMQHEQLMMNRLNPHLQQQVNMNQQFIQANFPPNNVNVQMNQLIVNNNNNSGKQDIPNNQKTQNFMSPMNMDQQNVQNPYQSMMMPNNLMPNNINNNKASFKIPPIKNPRQLPGEEMMLDLNAADLPPPPPAPLLPSSSKISNYQQIHDNFTPTSPTPPPPPPPPLSSQTSQNSNATTTVNGKQSEYPCPPTPPVIEGNVFVDEKKKEAVPAPPPPPPPPPPMTLNSTKSIQNQPNPISENTKKTEIKKTTTSNPNPGPPQDLLSAIRAGCTLRKVSETLPPVKDKDLGNGFTTLTRPHKDVQSIYDAVIKRRHMMEATSDSDKDSSDSTEGWDD